MQLLHFLSQHIENSAIFEDVELAVVDEFLSILYIRHNIHILNTSSGSMRFGTFYTNRVIDIFIAFCIGLVCHYLYTLTRYVEAGIRRSTRLTELRLEQVKEILHIVVFVVKENCRIGRIFLFHH